MEWWSQIVERYQSWREKLNSKKQAISETSQMDRSLDASWIEVPEYVPIGEYDKEIKQRISLVAACVATLDGSDKKLSVTKIHVRNPEFFKISMIVAAIVAQDESESQFIIRKIYKKTEA